MSSIQLLDLPDPIIAQILSHIPDHFEVSSVCKKFYEIDCHNSRKKSNLTLQWPRLDRTLESILSSNRTISQIIFEVNFHNPKEIEIVRKISLRHGSSVTRLTLVNKSNTRSNVLPKAKITEKVLLQLLNCFPNLKKVKLDLFKTHIQQGSVESSEVLNLTKLEELTICPQSLIFFTNRLPQNLRKLEMNFKDSNSHAITAEDRKIHAAKLDLLEKLKFKKLEELSFHDSSLAPIPWPVFGSFLRTQQNSLKSVVFKNIREDFKNKLLQNLESTKQLESLEIDDIKPSNIESYSKLTKLKRLKIKGIYSDFFKMSQVKSVPLENLVIENLTVRSPTNNNEMALLQIGQNFPIKFLTIEKSKEDFEDYLTNFPNLELLSSSYYNPFGFSTNMVSGIYLSGQASCTNLKLLKIKNFCGLFDYSCGFILKILSAFPNLEELDIDNNLEFSGAFLKSFEKPLGRLKKLKICSLTVSINKFCTEELIKTLQKLSNHLDSAFFEFYVSDLHPEIKFRFDSTNDKLFAKCLDRLRGYYRIEVSKDNLVLRK